MQEQETAQKKQEKGFRLMTREKKREIASKGGKAAHRAGTAHEWTAEEAAEAGRKGGRISKRGSLLRKKNIEEALQKIRESA